MHNWNLTVAHPTRPREHRFGDVLDLCVTQPACDYGQQSTEQPQTLPWVCLAERGRSP